MSIASEIARLQQAKADIKAALIEKGQTVTTETIDQYAPLIANISGAGGSQEDEVSVIFYDIDGTFLKEDFVKIGENAVPPDAPVKPGLTFTEWTYPITSVEQDLDVAPIYTYDDCLHMGFHKLNGPGGTFALFIFKQAGTLSVEWSDGHTQTYTGTNSISISRVLSRANQPSFFQDDYWIKLRVVGGYFTYTLGGSGVNGTLWSSGALSTGVFYPSLKDFFIGPIGTVGCTGFTLATAATQFATQLENIIIPPGFNMNVDIPASFLKTVVIPRLISPTNGTYRLKYPKDLPTTIPQGYTAVPGTSSEEFSRIIFPKGVTNITSNISHTRGPTKLVFPTTLTAIGGNNFIQSKSITDIIFLQPRNGALSKGSMQHIIHCPALKNLVGWPGTTGTQDNYVYSASSFEYATYWSPNPLDTPKREFTVPTTDTVLGPQYFPRNLFRKVNINHTVTSINLAAFYGCAALTSIDLTNCLNVIMGNMGDQNFICHAKEIIFRPNSFPTSNVFGGTWFRYLGNVVTLDFSQQKNYTGNLANSGDGMFRSSNSLRTLKLPPKATGNISVLALLHLQVLDIPGRITGITGTIIESLGLHQGLRELTIMNSAQVVTLSATSIISGCMYTALAKIYVPDHLVDSYKTATNWSTFSSHFLPMSSLERFRVLTLDSQGGTTVNPVYTYVGSIFLSPTNPTKTDFTFGGWYTSLDFDLLYDFDDDVTNNLTLYAKWV